VGLGFMHVFTPSHFQVGVKSLGLGDSDMGGRLTGQGVWTTCVTTGGGELNAGYCM